MSTFFETVDKARALLEPSLLLIERSILEARRADQDAAMKAPVDAKRVFRSMGVTALDEALASAIA